MSNKNRKEVSLLKVDYDLKSYKYNVNSLHYAEIKNYQVSFKVEVAQALRAW